jgi:hypothetical protein
MRPVFYLPRHHWPDAASTTAWREGRRAGLLPSGKSATAQAWIYRTWSELGQAGHAFELVSEMPADGVVVTLNGCLPSGYTPPRGLFVAGLAADGGLHPGPHCQILQNSWHAARFPRAEFMPHWPQPDLAPRSPERGDTLVNVRFYGDPANLAPELRDSVWQDALRRETGATFEVVDSSAWHDYRTTDAVVAIRDFCGSRLPRKPATKLYNAWLAGVPFIGGEDSAYASDGRAGTDYFVARSPAEVMHWLRILRDDPLRRRQLVESGTTAVRRFDTAAITARWIKLLEQELPERAAREARRTEGGRRLDILRRRWLVRIDALRHRR